ncbi:DUF2225 domain-containing protein [Clostridium vincentii]|uniref:DUF2225 domain-containing protein n=1 Tax=Clostridium vincentii TaxID=52704 RepID=A0A2T0BGJ5_9CLOT|nr:DUF2225 domain-containing protein [Clostridium vincentii]PRR83026.1 hypothetical protein CLVI_12750 [Clostridium vincentii]
MSETDLKIHIYDKEIICPICNSKFNVKIVKVNSPRITSKDSDFFIRYRVINPYFYDVWVCNSCGYSAIKADFPKIKSHQKDIILNEITRKWRPHNFPENLTVPDAINRYKLALVNSMAINATNSSIAMIFLKLGWMFRLNEDIEKENLFLNQSLQYFLKSFSLENFPIYGMQRDSFSYLIGDLYRRTNKSEEALRWYSTVITTVGASVKVKELARTGKDIINKKY